MILTIETRTANRGPHDGSLLAVVSAL